MGFAIILVLYATTSLHEHAWAARNNIRYISPFIMMILICNVIMWRFFSLFIKLVLSFSLTIALTKSFRDEYKQSKYGMSYNPTNAKTLFQEGLSEMGMSFTSLKNLNLLVKSNETDIKIGNFIKSQLRENFKS